jgi:ankyrin repeat protein
MTSHHTLLISTIDAVCIYSFIYHLIYHLNYFIIFKYIGGNVNFVKDAKDEDGKGLLHIAAANGLISSVTWLLNKGAMIDIRTGMKQKTPLMMAAENNHIEVVLVLLRRGAMINVNSVDVDGRSALHYAANKASIEMAQVFI